MKDIRPAIRYANILLKWKKNQQQADQCFSQLHTIIKNKSCKNSKNNKQTEDPNSHGRKEGVLLVLYKNIKDISKVEEDKNKNGQQN